jgi:hypothetical protein
VAATKLEFAKSPQIMELYKNASIPDNVKRFNSMTKPNNNNNNNNNKPKVAEANTARASSSMQQGNVPILGTRNEPSGERQRPSIQELLKKQYVFKRAMIKGFFNQVVEYNHIKLPDPKRPDQVGMTNNPLYCPYHRYVGHVIEDCVGFKEWLQRAIDEKRLALQPDAINPDYHAVNMVSIGSCPESAVEEGKWVPLMQLEKELTNMHISQGNPKANVNQWHIVRHYKPPRRDFQRCEASRVASYSKKSVPWQHDPSRRRLPRRFVPMSEGDAQFPRHGRILPTLAQFMPQDWGQSSQSPTLEKEAAREECNVILQHGDNASSASSDEGLTPLECETL